MDTAVASFWKEPTVTAFMAGLLVAFVISILLSKFHLTGQVRRLGAWVSGNVRAICVPRRRTKVTEKPLTEIEAEREQSTMQQTTASLTSISKPFEFRERLWNEPPEMDYEVFYGCMDTVQKKFKDMGGKELAWRTGWLDLLTEGNLLKHYQGLLVCRNQDTRLSEKERAFNEALWRELETDVSEELQDWDKHNASHEKMQDEYIKLYAIFHSTRHNISLEEAVAYTRKLYNLPDGEEDKTT